MYVGGSSQFFVKHTCITRRCQIRRTSASIVTVPHVMPSRYCNQMILRTLTRSRWPIVTPLQMATRIFPMSRYAPNQIRLLSTVSSKTIEDYLDEIEEKIRSNGGEINAAPLGSISKPASVSERKVTSILAGYPQRFGRSLRGSTLYIKLIAGGTSSSAPPSLDEYLDEIEKKIRSNGGEITAGPLGSIPKPTSMPKSKKLARILADYPQRFGQSLRGSTLYITLIAGGTSSSALPSLEKYFDETEKQNRSNDEAEYNLVESKADLVEAVARIETELEEMNLLDGQEVIKVVAVDLEGDHQLELLQIATSGSVHIFDCQTIGRDVVVGSLDFLLSSEHVIKLVHDARQDAVKLASCGSSFLQGFLDTQLVAEHACGYPFVGLNKFLELAEVTTNSEKERMIKVMNEDENVCPFESRPISPENLQYAAYDVICLLKTIDYIWHSDRRGCIEMLLEATSSRIADALVDSGGARRISFDLLNNFNIRSAELLDLYPGQVSCSGSKVSVSSDLQPLLEILPTKLREECMIRNASGQLDRASDIVLDVGERPQFWINGKRNFVTDEESRVITTDEIEGIVGSLPGGFGRDGRAMLPDSLNRVSAMRGRQSEILGVTMRIGRSITNISDLLVDVLCGSDKSILILGNPGSGKTSLLRDMARRLAETQNVVIVDKSNEIGGDGPTVHKNLGLCRRMMVPPDSSQEKIMIECVENHFPKVMVIDEIGHENQVSAAGTVKNRGVRMIASAHGDVCGLVDNQVLRGLVGGVQSVILGDDEVAKRKRRKGNQSNRRGGFRCAVQQAYGKVIPQRVGPPIFDVIVELNGKDKHGWKVVPDTGSAVDDILEGRSYSGQIRSRDPDTGAMFYEFANDSRPCSHEDE